ncbi:MAG: PIN domain-containing protein [Thermoplasmata archaeon]
MTGTADLNLVLAVVKSKDRLRDRAVRHLERFGPLLVPFSVALELLFVAKRFGLGYVEILGATEAHFDLERREVLYTAAEALDAGDVKTVFDAVHLADAFHRGGALHTADRELLQTAFPTVGF